MLSKWQKSSEKAPGMKLNNRHGHRRKEKFSFCFFPSFDDEHRKEKRSNFINVNNESTFCADNKKKPLSLVKPFAKCKIYLQFHLPRISSPLLKSQFWYLFFRLNSGDSTKLFNFFYFSAFTSLFTLLRVSHQLNFEFISQHKNCFFRLISMMINHSFRFYSWKG